MLTQDLMMSSAVSSVARASEEPLKTASSVATATKLIADHQPRLLLIDLQTPSLEISEVAQLLESVSGPNRPRAVGYAQHVYKELLDEATQAGFDQILTRGQMHGNVSDVLEAR